MLPGLVTIPETMPKLFPEIFEPEIVAREE